MATATLTLGVLNTYWFPTTSKASSRLFGISWRCSSSASISVALLTLLPLFIGFSVDDWFVVADVKNQISSSGWKNQKAGKTRGVRREVQVIIVVLGV